MFCTVSLKHGKAANYFSKIHILRPKYQWLLTVWDVETVAVLPCEALRALWIPCNAWVRPMNERLRNAL